MSDTTCLICERPVNDFQGETDELCTDCRDNPAAACALLPRLLQTMVKRGGYAEGHYKAREFWLKLLEKSNSLTRENEVCALIVEAVRKVKGEGK